MEIKEKNQRPFNLQFFAEGDPDSTPDGNGGEDDAPTIEELQSQLAIATGKAEETEKLRQKDKAALDKALKEVARLTKEARANKTEAEIEAENKRLEAEKVQEELASLREYRRHNEAKERYLLQGMDAENATKAADAEVAGDMDALADIQKRHTESLIKAKEAEWKKNRPNPTVGDGSYPTMTKEEIFKIEDDQERLKAIAQNMSLFQ